MKECLKKYSCISSLKISFKMNGLLEKHIKLQCFVTNVGVVLV